MQGEVDESPSLVVYKLDQSKSTLWLLLVKLQAAGGVGRFSVLSQEDPRSSWPEMMHIENLKNGVNSSWPTEDLQREKSFELYLQGLP